VVLANFALAAVMYSLQTTIAEYAQGYGATSMLAGIAAGIYTIGGLMTRLGAPGWMKRIGWRKMALLFTGLHFLACLLYFAAVNLPVLIIVRFLHGLAFGAAASVIMTIGMAMVPQSRYGEGSGYILMGPAMAMAVGPYLSGYIVDHYGGTGSFIMASAFAMLFFTLFAETGPINTMLMQIGLLRAPYKFLSRTFSARTMVAYMNFLMWFGNTTILLLAGILGIDQSLYEAAEVDGATPTQIFFHITLPILRPILLYVVITSLIGGLQLFDVPQILTNGQGGPNRTTMTLIMYLNKHLYSKNYGLGGALSVILFIITGILSLIVFQVNTRTQR